MPRPIIILEISTTSKTAKDSHYSRRSADIFKYIQSIIIITKMRNRNEGPTPSPLLTPSRPPGSP